MEQVLQNLDRTHILGYIDDIITHSGGKNANDHQLQLLDTLLDAHISAGLKINPEKSHLFQTQVEYLGHLVTEQGIAMIPKYRKLLEEWPEPKTQQELTQFLGKMGYYSQFLGKDYARTRAPLDKLRSKKEQFTFGKEEREAFKKIRSMVSLANGKGPLAFPDVNMDASPLIADSDWSKEGMGYELSQVQNGKERLIATGGRKCSLAESRYSANKGETAAIVFCVEQFEHLLRLRKFTIRTDHMALQYLKTSYKLKDALWVKLNQYLNTFDCDIQFREGRFHTNVDINSRCAHLPEPTQDETEEIENIGTLVHAIDLSLIHI